MLAIKDHEHLQPSAGEPVSLPQRQDVVGTPPAPEAQGVEIPSLVMSGVGELTLGAFAGSNEGESSPDSPVLPDTEATVHPGSDSIMYLKGYLKRSQMPSVGRHSSYELHSVADHSERVAELRKRGLLP